MKAEFSSRTAASCEVLVIGGGLAATIAAIAAAQMGAMVTMIVKGRIGVSGSSARAGGIIAASFGHTPIGNELPWDNCETHAADTLAVGLGLCSEPLVYALTSEACSGIEYLQHLGVTFSVTEDGRFHQLMAPGNTRPRACSVIGAGAALMSHLRKIILSNGICLFEDAMASELIVCKGRVIGARCVDVLSGSPFVVYARQTILATGGGSGLFGTVSGDDRNTGDGLILAYDAGAQLANLEFSEFTLIYRVKGRILKLGGLAPFLSRGAVLVNRLRERFMERYFSPEELKRAVRSQILQAAIRETTANRAPIFLDCTPVSAEAWDEFERTQGALMLNKIREVGCDYKKELIEVLPAAHTILAGVVIDANCQTAVDGLWAAGECATGIHGAARLSGNGLAACTVFGRRAGENAAKTAIASRSDPWLGFGGKDSEMPVKSHYLPPDEVKKIRGRITAIAARALGVIRNKSDLSAAKVEFSKILDQLRDRAVGTLDSNLIELKNLATLGLLMADAALRRNESRGLHFRSDAANSDQSWIKWLVATKDSIHDTPTWTHYDEMSETKTDTQRSVQN